MTDIDRQIVHFNLQTRPIRKLYYLVNFCLCPFLTPSAPPGTFSWLPPLDHPLDEQACPVSGTPTTSLSRKMDAVTSPKKHGLFPSVLCLNSKVFYSYSWGVLKNSFKPLAKPLIKFFPFDQNLPAVLASKLLFPFQVSPVKSPLACIWISCSPKPLWDSLQVHQRYHLHHIPKLKSCTPIFSPKILPYLED